MRRGKVGRIRQGQFWQCGLRQWKLILASDEQNIFRDIKSAGGKHNTFQRQIEIIFELFTVLGELYIGCASFGHEPKEWSPSLGRPNQGAYKDCKKCLGFPASVCSSTELQTDQNFFPLLFKSHLVFSETFLVHLIYTALFLCKLHAGYRWVFDFRESFHVFMCCPCPKEKPLKDRAHCPFMFLVPQHLPQSQLSVNAWNLV